ncbi:diguanylate cyclase domain-containing protein [Curvibacter lanceolatus]|jgi:diguanylate cyclase (GGDEF)-like protein/PAS domain S-box-containing protein|uniref:diguanylate cyclase domain-containing protein n=1 Tax=Curvibacter lanceolatus TaxID=86182 RepID=UPI0003AA00B1|nr:diguanylate cyclase [Curvibacter lanceolatus]
MAKKNIPSHQLFDSARAFSVKLMQFLVVPTFVLAPDGRVLIWNRACETLTGLDAKDVVGTKNHWRGFYETPRPCLADLIVEGRTQELDGLYVTHGDPEITSTFGVHAENWCHMPRRGVELYLAIDAGPIYDDNGELLAVVETLRDISVQKRSQTALERLALVDGLTGVLNRRGFDEQMTLEWSRARSSGLPITLLMIDVDNFKSFNDHYGHPLGDECLRTVARALGEAVLRPNDIVARYGGEEFAFILPGADAAGADVVATRIRTLMAEAAIPHSAGGIDGHVTVSVGGATVMPRIEASSLDLIRHADAALYKAKSSGRNCFVAWQENSTASHEAHL